MWAKQQKGLKQDNEADLSEGDHADMPFIVERMKNHTPQFKNGNRCVKMTEIST